MRTSPVSSSPPSTAPSRRLLLPAGLVLEIVVNQRQPSHIQETKWLSFPFCRRNMELPLFNAVGLAAWLRWPSHVMTQVRHISIT